MNVFTTRLARDDDAENIELVIHQWWGTDKRCERVEAIRRALHKAGHDIILAESGGKIIGMLHLVINPTWCLEVNIPTSPSF